MTPRGLGERAWWSDARRLYGNPRLSLKAIGRLLQKHDTTVLYAVDEDYRERQRAKGEVRRRKVALRLTETATDLSHVEIRRADDSADRSGSASPDRGGGSGISEITSSADDRPLVCPVVRGMDSARTEAQSGDTTNPCSRRTVATGGVT